MHGADIGVVYTSNFSIGVNVSTGSSRKPRGCSRPSTPANPVHSRLAPPLQEGISPSGTALEIPEADGAVLRQRPVPIARASAPATCRRSTRSASTTRPIRFTWSTGPGIHRRACRRRTTGAGADEIAGRRGMHEFEPCWTPCSTALRRRTQVRVAGILARSRRPAPLMSCRCSSHQHRLDSHIETRQASLG